MTSQGDIDRHSFTAYERYEREMRILEDYLTRRGFGVECRTEGVVNTTVMLLDGIFTNLEPSGEELSLTFSSPDQVPGGLFRVADGVDYGFEALDTE